MSGGAQTTHTDASFFAAAERKLDSATESGMLLVDRRLRIRGLNTAYTQSTLHQRKTLIDRSLFDCFPDSAENPDKGMPTVAASLERVLRTQQPDTLWVQRYDIPDPRNPGAVIPKVWTLVHEPLFDQSGRVAGVIQRSDDLTGLDNALARFTAHENSTDRDAWHKLLDLIGPGGSAIPRYRQRYLALARENHQLREAQQSRAAIEQAKGILMGQRCCSAAEAFEILRRLSQDTNRKLRDVAVALIEDTAQQTRQ